MLRELLWCAAAKQQYDIQKSAGISGIFGILLVLLIVWQWNNVFQPIINLLGLDDFAKRIGIVTDTPIHTIINSAYLILSIALIIIFFMVLPTLLMLMGVALLDSKILMIPLSYILFFLLSPIIFCYLVFKKLNEYFRLTNKTGPETLKQHYYRNPSIRQEYKGAERFADQLKLHTLYTAQMKRNDSPCEIVDLTYDEAVKHLNRAVASIQTDTNWLLGYNNTENQWYILFPNPFPVFASKCMLDQKSKTPTSFMGYKEARLTYEDYLYSMNPEANDVFSGLEIEKPAFYVAALKIEYKWDGYRINLDAIEKTAPLLINVKELMFIIDRKDIYIKDLFSKICSRNDVQQTIKKGHIRSYLIPFAYPEEIKYLSYTNGILCYIHELNNVPYSQLYKYIYEADVQMKIQEYASKNCKWAKECLETI